MTTFLRSHNVGRATRHMVATLQEAVDHGTLYHGLKDGHFTNRAGMIAEMIRRGLLRRKPWGYCEITEAGYAALRGE